MSTAPIRARLRSAPGVARLRAYAEHVFAPKLRADVQQLQQDLGRTNVAHDELRQLIDQLSTGLENGARDLDLLREQVRELRAQHEELRGSVDGIEERAGTALDSLLSTNELARLARREMDALRDFVTASVASVDRPAEP